MRTETVSIETVKPLWRQLNRYEDSETVMETERGESLREWCVIIVGFHVRSKGVPSDKL